MSPPAATPRRRIGRAIVALFLALALPGAQADTGADGLRRADALARAGDWDEAVAALPPPADLTRENLPLLWRVAPALRDQRPEAALRLLAAIRRLDPDAPRPRVALESFWADYPALSSLPAEDLPLYPVDAEGCSLPAAGGLPAARVITVTPRPFVPLPPATEPRSGRSHGRLVTIYVDRGGALSLRFTVHFDGEEDADRARQIGRFLGAVSLAADRLLGPANRARYPMPVWLRPDGSPGAEQWAGAITVRGLRAHRAPLEWVRQLAHEWGHASIPGVQGFREPENWANGDLGERLFLPAMDRAGWLAAWTPGLDAAPYRARYVNPPREAFARTGPLDHLLADTSRAGYDHFLGAALYIEAAYGVDALCAALHDMDGQRPRDLLAAFSRTLADRREWTLTRAGDAPGDAPVCFPVAGDYMLEKRGEHRDADAPAPVRRFSAGWTMLTWSGELTVRRTVGTPEAPNARETNGRP